MKILLVSATSFEIQPTLDQLQKSGLKVRDCEIFFLITGIGAVPTAYHLSDFLFRQKPSIVVQAGIAGCFSEKALAETVVIKEDSFADMGVMENGQFKTIFDLGLAGANDFPYSNGRLINPHKKLLEISKLDQVKAVTVNEISTSKEKIELHQQKSNAIVESMEGAAFHYVCLQQKIPFLQIRSISNKVGERDKSKWEIKKSIGSLNEQLLFLIKKITTQDETFFRI